MWKKIEDMNQTRKNFSAIAMPDGLYVFGGNDGCQYLKSVEKYYILELDMTIFKKNGDIFKT